MSKKHYLVYKTTNLVNGKIYIGKHETDNLDDGYLGSGKLLKRAIEKYGEENFQREILFECSSKAEMDAREAELVNEDFLKRDDVYNLKQGGEGGFDYINSTGINNCADNAGQGGRKNAQLLKTDSKYRKNFLERMSSGVKRVWKEHPELWDNVKRDSFKGRTHTKEVRKRISEAMKRCTGEKNNSWGTKWIHNKYLKQTIRVHKDDLQQYLDSGWELGAVYEWTKKKS